MAQPARLLFVFVVALALAFPAVAQVIRRLSQCRCSTMST